MNRKLRLDPLWLALPGVIFLALFLVGPTAQMLSLSVMDRTSGALSFSAFSRIVNGRPYLAVLSTTFAVAGWTTFFCVGLGYPVAYWLAGKPPRQQRIAALFILLPFWTSALIKNFSWLVLLGRNGIVAKTFAVAGLPGGDRILFNQGTVIFAMTHTLLPLAVVTMLPVMNQIDRRLPMAAQTLGANHARAFWQVFFPLSMRGVAASGLLVLVASLGFFITPALVGGARDTMIGQLIILQINDLQNWQMGSALAAILLLSAIATCFAYDRIFGSRHCRAAAAGARDRIGWSAARGSRRRNSLAVCSAALKRAWTRHPRRAARRRSCSLYAWIVIAVLLVPIIAFVPMAFTASSFLSFPPQGELALVRAVRCFAAVARCDDPLLRHRLHGGDDHADRCGARRARGYAHARPARRRRVSFVSVADDDPSIVTAIGLFFLFAKISLVATDLGIIIGHTVIAMPIVFVIMLATFKGHDWSLDAAAATLGAGRPQVLRRVTLPLVASGLAVGFVTGFLQSFEELTVALFVGGGLKTTLPKQMWDGILLQVNPVIAAASVVVLCVVLLMFASVEIIRARRTAG